MHIELTDNFNEVQGRYYGIGADIARLEQAIQHHKERKVQLQQDIQSAKESLAQVMEQQALDNEKFEQRQEELAEAEPELELCNESVESSQEQLAELEDAMVQWQHQWDEFNQSASGNTQKNGSRTNSYSTS